MSVAVIFNWFIRKTTERVVADSCKAVCLFLELEHFENIKEALRLFMNGNRVEVRLRGQK